MKLLPVLMFLLFVLLNVALSAPQSKDITNASPLPPSNFQPEFDEIVVESALNVRRKSKERQSRNNKAATTTTTTTVSTSSTSTTKSS